MEIEYPRARRLLDDTYETAELFTLGPIPTVPTIAWRHEQAEAAVGRAIALEADGRHLLFADRHRGLPARR